MGTPDTPFFNAGQYESICNGLPDPAFILSVSGRYLAILGGKDKRYYHDGSSLAGKLLTEVLVASKAQWFLDQIQTTLRSQQMLVVEYELHVRDVLGLPVEGPSEAIWFEGRISPLDGLYDGEAAVVWVASNITGSKRLQQQLQMQALTDELTGLPNRRRFVQALDAAFVRFVQAGENSCVISFDVDHFKAINDGMGHPAGDQALCDLAIAVQSIVGHSGLLCRLGGDEFAILYTGCDLQQSAVLAQQLLVCAREVLESYATEDVRPSLSVGLAHFSPQDHSVEGILQRADQGLYQSKTQGGHGVCAVTHDTATTA